MVLVKTVSSISNEQSPDIRRFTLDGRGDFPSLKAKIVETYAYLDAKDLEGASFRWTDQDGDNITIANSEDWFEAVRFADEDWFQCVRVLVDAAPVTECGTAVNQPTKPTALTADVMEVAPTVPRKTTTMVSKSSDSAQTAGQISREQAAAAITELLERRASLLHACSLQAEKPSAKATEAVRDGMAKASAVLEAFFDRRFAKKNVRFSLTGNSDRSQLLEEIRRVGSERAARRSQPGKLTDSAATIEVMQTLTRHLQRLAKDNNPKRQLDPRQKRMEECRFQCNRHMSWNAGMDAAKRCLEIQKVLRNIALRY